MQEKLWTATLSAVARAELMQLLRILSSAMYHLLAAGGLGCDGWMWVWVSVGVCGRIRQSTPRLLYSTG